jgi:hypothetical protein
VAVGGRAAARSTQQSDGAQHVDTDDAIVLLLIRLYGQAGSRPRMSQLLAFLLPLARCRHVGSHFRLSIEQRGHEERVCRIQPTRELRWAHEQAGAGERGFQPHSRVRIIHVQESTLSYKGEEGHA